MNKFNFYYTTLLVSLLLIIITTDLCKSQIIINEYSCANLKTIEDNFGKYEDWIELYNTGEEAVDVAGYYLSDKKKKLQKWIIPAAKGSIIQPKGYLVIWASKRDTAYNENFHSNFTLKQTRAERIILTGPSGNVIDSLTVKINQREHSTGRVKDGSTDWGVFNKPTPGETNNNSVAYSYADKPVFSLIPGFFSNAIEVSISSKNPNDTIRYTLDGWMPDRNSNIYIGAVKIESTSILKAKVFSADSSVLPGLVEFGTYFINENHSLPVVSVSADSLIILANDSSAHYYDNGSTYWGDDPNFWNDSSDYDSIPPSLKDLLRPFGAFEYYENNILKTRATGEFNAHGKDSWICDQKSLDFISRDECGEAEALKGRLFSLSKRKKYQRIILRSSGDDNYPCGHQPDNKGSAHVRDGYIHNLVKRSDLKLDVRMSEHVILYINGQYWGVYEIRDNPDDHDHTKYNYDQDKYHIQYILTWGETWVKYGGDQALADWKKLYDFILRNDMKKEENYDKVKSELNVKSLVDYILVNSFTVCSDWLNYNVGWWRGLDPKGDHKKWGFILWDNDATFGHYINYTEIPDTTHAARICDPETLDNYYSDPEGFIKILNKLKENQEFYEYYVNRQVDLMNTTFSCDSMLSYFDEYVAMIDPEMERHAKRWYGTYNEWKQNVNQLRAYIEQRCATVHESIGSCNSLSGPYDVVFDADKYSNNTIKVNSVDIETLPWKAKLYDGINTNLKIKTKEEFFGWSSRYTEFLPDYKEKEVAINCTKNDTIIAHLKHFTSIAENNIDPFTAKVYPTVTSGNVQLEYQLNTHGQVSVCLYNLKGQKVVTLINKDTNYGAGNYKLSVDLSGSGVAPGVYFMNIIAGNNNKTFKLVYLP